MLNYEFLEKIIESDRRKDIAAKTGLTQGFVTKILDKKITNISIATAVKIAKAYKVSLDDLILLD